MAITGTGTQSDPYIVGTWDEFVSVVGTSGVYVEVVSGSVWDMNEIAPNGLTSTVNLYAIVKGNGLVIRNLRSSLDVTFEVSNTSPEIWDISFENIIQSGGAFIKGSITWATYSYCRFHNCVFTGKMINAVFLELLRTGAVFSADDDSSCGFEFDFCGSGYFCNVHYDIGTTMTDCVLKFGGESTGSNSRIKNLTNCEICGEQPWSSWNIGNLTTSIVNMEIDSSQSFTASPSVTLLNTGKAQGTISGNFLEVTDSQLKDASYLQSIGFPIGD